MPLSPSRVLGVPAPVSWAPAPNLLTCHLGEEPPGPVTSVLAAVTDPAGRLLMVRVASRGWDLPGGHVEAGETPGEALVRELYEEAGLRLTTPARPVGWLHLHVPGPVPAGYAYPHPDSHMVLYAAAAPAGYVPAPTVPAEIAEAAFVDPAALAELGAGRTWLPLVTHLLTGS